MGAVISTISPEQIGITVGLVIGITFIFDVIELQPRVGFGFLRSLNYLFYHIFRVLLGLLASYLIFQINPNLELPFIAFLAVLASVTTLQNFTMNVGGSEIANLSSMLDNYKERMLVEQEQRNVKRVEKLARINATNSLRIQQEMMELFSLPELEMHLRQMLLQAGWDTNTINSHVQELKNGAQDNLQFLEAVMAYQIVDMNLEYARSLIPARQGFTTAALTIITTSLPIGAVGVLYSQTLRASSRNPTDTWSIVGGGLPPGFCLNTNTGTISGTPTTAGTFNFTAKVNGNVGGILSSATKDLSVTIANPPAIS